MRVQFNHINGLQFYHEIRGICSFPLSRRLVSAPAHRARWVRRRGGLGAANPVVGLREAVRRACTGGSQGRRGP